MKSARVLRLLGTCRYKVAEWQDVPLEPRDQRNLGESFGSSEMDREITRVKSSFLFRGFRSESAAQRFVATHLIFTASSRAVKREVAASGGGANKAWMGAKTQLGLKLAELRILFYLRREDRRTYQQDLRPLEEMKNRLEDGEVEVLLGLFSRYRDRLIDLRLPSKLSVKALALLEEIFVAHLIADDSA